MIKERDIGRCGSVAPSGCHRSGTSEEMSPSARLLTINYRLEGQVTITCTSYLTLVVFMPPCSSFLSLLQKSPTNLCLWFLHTSSPSASKSGIQWTELWRSTLLFRNSGWIFPVLFLSRCNWMLHFERCRTLFSIRFACFKKSDIKYIQIVLFIIHLYNMKRKIVRLHV